MFSIAYSESYVTVSATDFTDYSCTVFGYNIHVSYCDIPICDKATVHEFEYTHIAVLSVSLYYHVIHSCIHVAAAIYREKSLYCV